MTLLDNPNTFLIYESWLDGVYMDILDSSTHQWLDSTSYCCDSAVAKQPGNNRWINWKVISQASVKPALSCYYIYTWSRIPSTQLHQRRRGQSLHVAVIPWTPTIMSIQVNAMLNLTWSAQKGLARLINFGFQSAGGADCRQLMTTTLAAN